jgi:hypothetical protein
MNPAPFAGGADATGLSSLLPCWDPPRRQTHDGSIALRLPLLQGVPESLDIVVELLRDGVAGSSDLFNDRITGLHATPPSALGVCRASGERSRRHGTVPRSFRASWRWRCVYSSSSGGSPRRGRRRWRCEAHQRWPLAEGPPRRRRAGLRPREDAGRAAPRAAPRPLRRTYPAWARRRTAPGRPALPTERRRNCAAEGEENPFEGDGSPPEGEESPPEGEENPCEGEESPSHAQESPSEGEEDPFEGEDVLFGIRWSLFGVRWIFFGRSWSLFGC